VGQNWYKTTNILMGPWAFLVFAKNLPPLEPKLLKIWEIIDEALKRVYSAYQFAKTW
jgi:hypothetical protein